MYLKVSPKDPSKPFNFDPNDFGLYEWVLQEFKGKEETGFEADAGKNKSILFLFLLIPQYLKAKCDSIPHEEQKELLRCHAEYFARTWAHS